MSGKKGANRGQRNNSTVITEKTAALIKWCLGKGWDREAIMDRTGATRSVVRDIERGKSWGWL